MKSLFFKARIRAFTGITFTTQNGLGLYLRNERLTLT